MRAEEYLDDEQEEAKSEVDEYGLGQNQDPNRASSQSNSQRLLQMQQQIQMQLQLEAERRHSEIEIELPEDNNSLSQISSQRSSTRGNNRPSRH